jgi:molybdopterin-guanine dinucleotide biosynthesis protein A
MGTDKAFLDFGGQSLLDHALAAVSAVCDSVTIVGDPEKFVHHPGYKVVADIFPGCGPLGGIHAALARSAAEFNLMLAVDMPFVATELLAFLFARAEEKGNDAVVTVPRVAKRLQPLCAIYRREFSTVAEQALREGKYKIDAAFSNISIRVIEERELAEAGFSEPCFFNVNNPQDRAAAETQRFSSS